MTAFISGTLFKRNLMRFWPIAAVSFLASLLTFVIPETSLSRVVTIIYNPGVQVAYDQYGKLIDSVQDIMTTLAIYCAVVVFPLSILTAIAVFGYLHNLKASVFVSSLPITRTGLYITNWLSGLVLMLAPLLLVGGLYGIVLDGQLVTSLDYLRWVGALVASHFVFYSIAVFCTFLTGNPIMQAFIYGVSSFIFLFFYSIGTGLASLMVFGYSPTIYSSVYNYVVWLTPPLAIIRMIELMSPSMVISFSHAASISPVLLHWLIYLAFTALMVFFGWVLYRRRHIEVAGEVLVHKPVKSVFKYLMGLLTGILFTIILMIFVIEGQSNSISTLIVWLTLSTTIFGALGCLFAEILIQKRLRVWKTTYKGIIVFVLSIAAVILFIRLDGTGFERRVPNQTNVVSVTVSDSHVFMSGNVPTQRSGTIIVDNNGDNWNLSRDYLRSQERLRLPFFDDAILHEIKLRNLTYFESPEAIAAVIRLHQTIADHGLYLMEDVYDIEYSWNDQIYTITYAMKNGSVLTRSYALPMQKTGDNSLAALLLDLYNQPESVDKRNRFVDLPDSAVLGAILTPTLDDFDKMLVDVPYSQRVDEGEHVFLEENLSIILDALRKDSANGTLGRIEHGDLLPAGYLYEDSINIGVIDLLLDFSAAGVPAAFEPDHFTNEDGSFTAGLILSIKISETHVNTVRVLEELQYLSR